MTVIRWTALFVIFLGMLAGCANKGVNSDSVSEARKGSREIPNWFLEPPVEEEALYSTGVARSSDMQMGMDRAMLAAKRDLAGQINNRLSSKMKEFVSEVGQGGNTALNREVSTITKNVVTEVNLAGYRRTKSKMVSEGKNYRVFVLLRYPIDETNRMLFEQINGNNKT